jgi:hypothetical protein
MTEKLFLPREPCSFYRVEKDDRVGSYIYLNDFTYLCSGKEGSLSPDLIWILCL